MVLGIELRVLHLLGRSSASELHSAQESAFDPVVQVSLGGKELEWLTGDPVKQPLFTLNS